MPIVRYQRQQTISAIDNSALIKKASTDEVSGAAVAETIGQSVEALAKRYGEIKKQNDEITKVNKINQYDTNATDYLINMHETKTGKESFELQKDFKDWATNKRGEYLKDVNDPNLATALNSHFDNMDNNIKLKISSFQVGQMKVVLDTAKQDALDIAQKGVITGLTSPYEAMELYKNKIGILRASKAIPSDEEAKIITKDGVDKIGVTYLDKMINENPTAALEQIKSDMWTNVLKPDSIKNLKHTALLSEKSKNLQDEKDKIEKELVYTEDLQKTFTKANANGSLSWAMVRKAATTDTTGWSSHGISNLNNVVEKYTAKLEAKQKENERLVKEGQKPANNAVYSSTLVRILTEPGNKGMLPEDKISEATINDLVTSGELRPDWGATLKDKLKKSQQSANPLRQAQVTWATKEIEKAQSNGLFGDKDSVESQMEVTNTLLALNAWLDQNPGKNPTDFTKELLAPYGIGTFKEAINFAYKGLGGTFGAEDIYTKPTKTPTPEIVKARQGEMLQGKTTKTTPLISPDETKAENYLTQKGLPVTPANKKYIIEQMRKKK